MYAFNIKLFFAKDFQLVSFTIILKKYLQKIEMNNDNETIIENITNIAFN